MGRREETIHKKYITKDTLLTLLKTGIILCIAVTAPGALKLFKGYGKKKPWCEYYPSSLERTAKSLLRQGKVEIKTEKDIPIVKITNKGREKILRYDLDKIAIKKPVHWDGKWRLVVFDINNKYKKTRDIIRGKLKGMGFYQFQESVFIYPYPCEKEIVYLREVLHVPHSIKLIRADRIENDSELRKIFKLN